MISVLLLITLFLNFYTTIRISILKNKSLLAYTLLFFNATMLVSTAGTFLQSLLNAEYVNMFGVIFESINAIGLVFFAPMLLTILLIFIKPNLKIRTIIPLFLVPLISLFALWTNDFHGLYFVKYSIHSQDVIYGKFYLLILMYSIIIFMTAFIGFSFLVYDKKNKYTKVCKHFLRYSGIFAFLVILNLLSVSNMCRLVNPILFSPFAFLFTIGLMEEKLINISPIATKEVTNIMSDPFLLLTLDGVVLEMNNSFEKNFGKKDYFARQGENFFEKLGKSHEYHLQDIAKLVRKSHKTHKVVSKEFILIQKNKEIYYDMDVQCLFDSSDECISILIIFKDITRHKNDLKTIETDQEILLMQQQMSLIGELASGFAHDINTPISAIRTGLSIIKCNKDLSPDDKQKIQDMEEKSDKIIKFSTNIRSQIRDIGKLDKSTFSVNELLKNIITISESEISTKNCHITFNETPNCFVFGTASKLSQVILNLLSNATDAYGKNGGEIIIRLLKSQDNIQIEIEDFAGGIDDKISELIFKKVLASKNNTKGGMGLYISNSIIKSMFNGDIKFTTKKGHGTKFLIILPISKELTKEAN